MMEIKMALNCCIADWVPFVPPICRLKYRYLSSVLGGNEKKSFPERMWEAISKDNSSPVNKAQMFRVSTEMVDEMEFHPKENLFYQEAFKSPGWDKEDQSV